MDDSHKQIEEQKKIKFRSGFSKSKKEIIKWGTFITILSFLLSAPFSLISSSIIAKTDVFIAVLLVIIIIIINILFDIVGTAVAAADVKPFHAMASRKVFGAKKAIALIKNADKVSNICNDVIGDICGIIGGSASAYIIIKFVGEADDITHTIADLTVAGIVAALTVGGKAFGKMIAIAHSNYIMYNVGRILSFFHKNESKNGNKKS